jgi:hypothetical protein
MPAKGARIASKNVAPFSRKECSCKNYNKVEVDFAIKKQEDKNAILKLKMFRQQKKFPSTKKVRLFQPE